MAILVVAGVLIMQAAGGLRDASSPRDPTVEITTTGDETFTSVQQEPAPTTPTTPEAPSATPEQVARQDAEEDDPRSPERLHRDRNLRALQGLPWQAAGVTIDIAPVPMRGDRLVLAVTYQPPLTPAQARQAYNRFLRLHRDTGRGYLPVVLTWDEYRAFVCEVNPDCALP